jgi:hypothetical protein
MLEKESKAIEARVSGWVETLSKPDLSSLVRTEVEKQFTIAMARKQEIEAELDLLANGKEHVNNILDPRAAIECLQRLSDILAGGSASDINIELALHIESILVHPNGTVVMRTNRLGLFEGAAEILAGEVPEISVLDNIDDEPSDTFKVRPRAISRRRTTGSAETSKLAKADGVIEGHVPLPEKWVDEAIFQMPKLISWAEEHAVEVAERRLAGRTIEQLCEEFDKVPATIRSSLRHAARIDDRYKDLPRKMARARWHEDHALEVAAKKHEGNRLGTGELAAFFHKSEPTILKALAHAAKLRGEAGDSGCIG